MLIDSHTHVGVMMNFYMPYMYLAETIRKYHIDFALCSNTEAAEFGHDGEYLQNSKTQEETYEMDLQFARKNIGEIGLTPWIRPRTQGLTPEFAQMIANNLDITFGIKVHPFHGQLAFDSQQTEEYIRFAEKYNLAVTTHTGCSDIDSCERVAHMAKKNPDVRFVMVHMGLGTDNTEAIKFIARYPNLYGDTTWVPLQSTLRTVEVCGSEKILFGSDAPIDGIDTYDVNRIGEPSLYRKYFDDLKTLLPPEDCANIFYKNAIRVFNLPFREELYTKYF